MPTDEEEWGSVVLVIRAVQLAALGKAPKTARVSEFAEMLARHWPARCEMLGTDGLLALVEQGIDRAGGYQLVRDREVLHFLNLMMAFGADFDRDPALPWAAEFLQATELSPTVRMEQLQSYASAQLHRLAGGS